VERDQIERALRYTRGHQGRAAELLGISRKTLWEKRRRYGLP
jgi:DNA-binding protein Fis